MGIHLPQSSPDGRCEASALVLGEVLYLAPGFFEEYADVLQFDNLGLRHLSVGASFSFIWHQSILESIPLKHPLFTIIHPTLGK